MKLESGDLFSWGAPIRAEFAQLHTPKNQLDFIMALGSTLAMVTVMAR
jgi:hypothetical protein